jgi:hypothetical protein
VSRIQNDFWFGAKRFPDDCGFAYWVLEFVGFSTPSIPKNAAQLFVDMNVSTHTKNIHRCNCKWTNREQLFWEQREHDIFLGEGVLLSIQFVRNFAFLSLFCGAIKQTEEL